MTEVTANAHIYVYICLSIHLYIPESLCCTPEANILLLINYSSKKEKPVVPRESEATQPVINPDGSAGPWER